MIRETIVTTQNKNGKVHLAPMGIQILEHEYLVMPFRPSTTLNNILETRTAVVNYTDDVRIFAGCLTGRLDWPLAHAIKIQGHFLKGTLAHSEVELVRIEEDETRPKLYCKAVHQVNHAPFSGFNRAQYSVLEAAILVSRLNMLPWKKIESELEYLRIGLDKTSGKKELEAWGWLMKKIEDFKHQGTKSE